MRSRRAQETDLEAQSTEHAKRQAAKDEAIRRMLRLEVPLGVIARTAKVQNARVRAVAEQMGVTL